MDPVLKALSDIRPPQNVRTINARLLDAGADFTIQEALQKWPEALPQFASIVESRDVISGVFFLRSVPGVHLNGVDIGDAFASVSALFPALEFKRRQDRKDGTYSETYVLNPDQHIQHNITVERERVILQALLVEADLQTRMKLFKDARNEAPFAETWAARSHGFSQKGTAEDRLNNWASSHRNDFHGNDWSKLADWLTKCATPTDRHAFARSYNWDHGVEPLVWIIHQPDTCMATLAEIFWLSEPGYFEEHRRDPQQPIDTDVFDLLWDLRDLAKARAAKEDVAPLIKFEFNPGDYAATYASDDPQSFFVPILCKAMAGQSPAQLPENWPIPIN